MDGPVLCLKPSIATITKTMPNPIRANCGMLFESVPWFISLNPLVGFTSNCTLDPVVYWLTVLWAADYELDVTNDWLPTWEAPL